MTLLVLVVVLMGGVQRGGVVSALVVGAMCVGGQGGVVRMVWVVVLG